MRHNSLIELKCENCGNNFFRNPSEHKRNLKKKRRTYCSPECSGQDNYRHLKQYQTPEFREQNLVKARIRIKELSEQGLLNRNDKFSPFRYFLRKAKERKKHGETNLTLEYLFDLWEKQQGKCSITYISLVPFKPTQKNKINSASLDRIDSQLGYIQGNVQFVCMGINLAKGIFSDAEIRQFIDSIVLVRKNLTSDKTCSKIEYDFRTIQPALG